MTAPIPLVSRAALGPELLSDLAARLQDDLHIG